MRSIGVGAVRKHEVQQAAFVVLKSPDIPSMLIETAYISNPVEERMLRTPAQQQRLAEAIFGGISGYFRKFPPEGSLFARARAERNPMRRNAGARRHLGARYDGRRRSTLPPFAVAGPACRSGFFLPI